MFENDENIDFSYFVCIFNFIKNYKIKNIKSKDKSFQIEFKEINNPYEKVNKTYLINSKLYNNKNVIKEIQIQFYEEKKENDTNPNNLITFESKIEFEKNQSKFLYELNYKTTGFFFQNNDGIKQDNYNFFKFYEFIKFINKIENKEKRKDLKKSLIKDSIKNFEKLKTKNEIEFFYLLLLMKE